MPWISTPNPSEGAKISAFACRLDAITGIDGKLRPLQMAEFNGQSPHN